MADRGRDLKISILSDVDRFDLAKPAADLEDLSNNTRDAGQDLDKFARDAKTTAGKVDDAFDKISKSSKSNFRRKMDDDVDHAKHKLGEFNDEARQSARESAASFTGAATDVQDLGQEILANAPAAFGPAGLAIGGALAAGFGLLFSKWTATKEAIKEQAGEIAQALIDSNGMIDKAFVESKLQQFVSDGTITQLAKQAQDAQVPVRDFVRAVAGDPAALERVNAQLAVSEREFNLNAAGSINAADAIDVHNGKLDAIRTKLGITTEATRTGTNAYQVYRDAVNDPVTPKFNGARAAQDADNYRTRLDAIPKTVTTSVQLDFSQPFATLGRYKRELAQIQSGRYRP